MHTIANPGLDLGRFFHMSPDLLCTVGSDGLFRCVNPAFCRALGYPERDILKRHLLDLVHPDDEPATRAELARLTPGGPLQHFVNHYRRLDRSYCLLEWTVAVAPDGVLYAQARDISERQELVQAQARLLSQAQDAQRAKAEFLANISHEIRTPLTAILGFLEIITRSELTDWVDEVEVIRRNSDRLMGLVGDLLELAELESGAMALTISDCSPEEVLERVLAVMGPRARDRGLRLELVRESAIPATLRSDAVRLQQVLLHLLSNAIKFTSEGGVTLACAMETLAGRPILRVRVKDTGIGMSEEALRRLYWPFSQEDSSMRRRYGGAGMGLAICKRLLGLLGGDITVQSAPGQGSEFSFWVPAGDMVFTPAPASAARDPGLTQTPARIVGRILLAEDSPDSQLLLAHLLRRAGAQVVIANNGVEALKEGLLAKERGLPYGLILMDMQMPELDGYEATARLRAAGYHEPIVALTAHALAGDRERCLAAGCDDYMAKPVRRDTLLDLVARYIYRENKESAPR